MDQTTLNKIGQLFMIGIKGTTLSEEEKKFIIANNICGITLFGRNIESPKQVYELCSSLKSLQEQMPNKTPLIIAIDMEGGRVHRFKKPFTIWPAQSYLEKTNSSSLSYTFGQALGAELHAIGINLNFSPCTDVLTNPKNIAIGDRSFSSDPEIVGKLASGVVRGLVKANVLPCAKHFPGHGNTIIDSHDDLPIDNSSLEEINQNMIPPFKKTFRSRVDFVMTSHIKYPALDNEFPATFSKKILTDLLRNEIRYRNLIISDDLDMGALINNYSIEEIPIKALNAGCDILLYCNNPDSHITGLESTIKAAETKQLDLIKVTESYDKILKIKEKIVKAQESMPTTWAEAEKIIGCQEHLDLAQTILEGRGLDHQQV